MPVTFERIKYGAKPGLAPIELLAEAEDSI